MHTLTITIQRYMQEPTTNGMNTTDAESRWLPRLTTLTHHKKYYCKISNTSRVLHTQKPTPPQDWDALLHQQPQWIQQMVRSIEFEDLTTVITQITTGNQVLAVSDGSAKIKGMTYGWVLATSKGTRIATGNGPSDRRPSSMRSEGQGMLAVSLFLAMIQLYTNSTDTIWA